MMMSRDARLVPGQTAGAHFPDGEGVPALRVRTHPYVIPGSTLSSAQAVKPPTAAMTVEHHGDQAASAVSHARTLASPAAAKRGRNPLAPCLRPPPVSTAK